MTRVAEGLTWAGEVGHLTHYLSLDPAELPLIEMLFNVAIEAADMYLGERDFTEPPFRSRDFWPGLGFTDEDPNEVLVDIPIPQMVRVGVFEYVRHCRLMIHEEAGVTAESVGQMSKQWDLYSARNFGDRPLIAARAFWSPHVLNGTTQGAAPKL